MKGAVRLIGIGNPWRGDDGVGPRIVEDLRGLPGVETATANDALALIEAWSGAGRVYLFDALRGGGVPGAVRRIDALAESLPTASNYSSHGFGLAEALALGRSLGRLPEQLVLIGIEGRCFESGRGLSAEVESAALRVAAGLRAELAELREDAAHA